MDKNLESENTNQMPAQAPPPYIPEASTPPAYVPQSAQMPISNMPVLSKSTSSKKIMFLIAALVVLALGGIGTYVFSQRKQETKSTSKETSSNVANTVAVEPSKSVQQEKTKCLSKADQLIWNSGYDVYESPTSNKSFLASQIIFFKADSVKLEFESLEGKQLLKETAMIVANKNLDFSVKLRAKINQPNGKPTAADLALVESRFEYVKNLLVKNGVDGSKIVKLDPIVDTKGYSSEAARNVEIFYVPSCVYVDGVETPTTSSWEYKGV